MKAMPIFVFALMAGQIVNAAGSDPEMFRQLLEYLLAIQHRGGAWAWPLWSSSSIPSLVAMYSSSHWGSRPFWPACGTPKSRRFSTSSSVATLPVTMDCVRNNIGVSERTTSFVLPIGATVNMDGTSLYQAVAVVSLAQFHMVDLSLAQQAVIVITATLASIGAAAVPSAGLVLMIIVLESVGLNPAWIALIFPVDRILDMCRTVVNVTGDGAVSTIIAHSENELEVPAQSGMNLYLPTGRLSCSQQGFCASVPVRLPLSPRRTTPVRPNSTPKPAKLHRKRTRTSGSTTPTRERDTSRKPSIQMKLPLQRALNWACSFLAKSPFWRWIW